MKKHNNILKITYPKKFNICNDKNLQNFLKITIMNYESGGWVEIFINVIIN